jgi:hypothetical protein
MSAINSVLEKIIPKDLLLELSDAGGIDVRVECPDDAPSASFLAGREATLPACHVSLAPEVASVHEDDLALEGASAPEGTAEDDPAPEGPGTGSPSATSMDAHVGSPMVRSDEAVVTSSDLLVSPTGSVTLEATGHGTEDPMGAPRVEIPRVSHLAWITIFLWCLALFLMLLLLASFLLKVPRYLRPLDFPRSFPTFRYVHPYSTLPLLVDVFFADFCTCRVFWTWCRLS